ncbi:MAG: formylmethanofuran dehydrogenase subunit B [Candidatus Thorarchaeota archaeon]|nr:formylmethanofuran dehydrogenase subunit B [Candidatus Thorarchaeota archaeon]
MPVVNVPCPFCGCLCDDIELMVHDGRIKSNRNGCAISKTKFLRHADDRLVGPSLRHSSGHELVSLATAVDHAARILSASKRPLVYGLSSTENDAHREAYRIAELVRGVVDNTSSVCHGPSILGTQDAGEPIGSLGEVRLRADLVVYWGSNPQVSHPRHLNRYTRPIGEFASKRTIWVVDVRRTVSAEAADAFYQIQPGHDLEVMSVLRALLRGHKLDCTEVGGLSIGQLQQMAESMRAAEYGVLFYGLGLTQSWGRHHNVDAAIRLVQELNEYAKWSMVPMRGHFNVAGANRTLTWTTGYPFAVDFSRGYPRYQPGEYTAVDLLQRGEVDALLNVAADPLASLPAAAVRHLRRIPVINLDPKRNLTSLIAEVNIPTAMAGIECDGVAVRMDGLPLYLRKVVEPPAGVLPDREVLRMIYDRMVSMR